MIIPCDCTNGFNPPRDNSEEAMEQAWMDNRGYWWVKCGECDGKGYQTDTDTDDELIMVAL